MFVITGGGSGIGQALAQALATRGKKVLIAGRREAALVETASFSPLIDYISADVSTAQGRKQIADYLQDNPVIEGLINNAGVIEPMVPLMDMDEASWQRTIATNLNAPLFLTQLLFNKLEQGRVLNIGTGVAYFPINAWSAYCVSKAALSMLTRCWQLESKTTAFASVMPGIIDTNMQTAVRNSAALDEEKRHFFVNLKQEGRLLSTATVALFLCWLLLEVDKAHYVDKEWDIYDTSHHQFWLVPPHQVPQWK